MINLNFFAPRIDEQVRARRRLWRLAGCVLIVLLLAGAVCGYNAYRIYSFRQKIEAIQTELNAPGMHQQYEEMRLLRTRQSIAGRYLQELKAVDAAVTAVDVIDDELLQQISATLPAGVALRSINLDINSLTLSCTAPSLRSIADFGYSLKECGLFFDVRISGLSGPTGGPYSFNVTGTFR